jgi:hypothetical protein
MNYDGKIFKPISNSDNGEVSSDLRFHYRQKGNVLSCTYHGANIQHGHLIGIVSPEGLVDMRYHQINAKGEICTGICQSRPVIQPNGKIRLLESWQWTSGDCSKGESVLEEI